MISERIKRNFGGELGNVNNFFDQMKNILIRIPPGVYEFEELNLCVQKLIQNFNQRINPKIEPISLKIEADAINMHCKLTTNYSIYFNSKLNEVFGFTQKYYSQASICQKKLLILCQLIKFISNAMQ